jgi:hypothetical protein
MGRLTLESRKDATREGQRRVVDVSWCWIALRRVAPRAFALQVSTSSSGIRSPFTAIGTLAETWAYRFLIAPQTTLQAMGE